MSSPGGDGAVAHNPPLSQAIREPRARSLRLLEEKAPKLPTAPGAGETTRCMCVTAAEIQPLGLEDADLR